MKDKIMPKGYKIVKSNLLAACIEKQQLMMKTAQEVIRDIQESALEGRSNEEMTDAFAAQCHNEQSMYARRLHEATGILTILDRAKSVKHSNKIGFGSLVITRQQNFLIAASIGAFNLEGCDFIIISAQTPVFKAMEGKEAGEHFEFRDREFEILEVI